MRRYSEIRREKRIKTVKITAIVLTIAVIVVLAGILTSYFLHHTKTGAVVVNKIEEITINPSEVSLVMVGDNILHMPVIKNGEQPDGTYNFDSLYENMLPYFDNSDMSVIVQETVLGGKELGYSGYPMFNTPHAVGDAIRNAGFDIVLHATNHTLDKGSKGVENTLEYWKKHPEITVLGINESLDKQNEVTLYEKNGIFPCLKTKNT